MGVSSSSHRDAAESSVANAWLGADDSLSASQQRSLPVKFWIYRFAVIVVVLAPAGLAADPPAWVTYSDPDYDVVSRPTDLGTSASFDPEQHHLIDLREITFGRWAPLAPDVDLFEGDYLAGGGFVRLDVLVAGLVNPPGSTDPVVFDPFRYGNHPVYGFMEIDVDDDNTTGGEVEAPQFRYLGNIARFGGLPEGEAFLDRAAESGAAFDADFLTEPFVERHGEEFHLALLGDLFSPSDVAETAGDGDLVFEAGEVWVITATWLHRAHGFEPFSLATGGEVPGEYAPECCLRFEHQLSTDVTRLSLVFPLNNAAAAAMYGETPEPPDHDPSNQASVSEALRDLRISAEIIYAYPTGEPEEVLILGWKDKTPSQFLRPTDWRFTALLGTTYAEPGHGFVWTDAYPNVLRGDVDGEHGLDSGDITEVEEYIVSHDEDDGVADSQVLITEFAEDFSLYDINHDGIVGAFDVLLVSPAGDCNLDGRVDLADYALWQSCHGASGDALELPCALDDLDCDGDVDLGDFKWFSNVLAGPAAP